MTRRYYWLLPFAVRATFCIQAAFGNSQTLDGMPLHQMPGHDLLHIGQLDEAIPDRFRIDDHHRSMLTLVETAGFVRANLVLQTSIFDRVLERRLQLFTSRRKATGPRRALVPLVGADKEVFLKACHLVALPN